ncbi:signal peptidase I [bacterium]|nr:signal peptidase I [bacterium]
METSYDFLTIGPIAWVIYIAFILFYIIVMWKVFVKAGQPGWGILIPIYNVYLILKIAKRPGWWLILYLIPVVNLIIAIMIQFDIAKNFKKGVGFGFGLLLLGFIFYPILAFGDAKYNK